MLRDRNGRPISCLDDWQALAPPKSPGHWVEGRSAYELARAWCGDGPPAVPPELRALLDSRPDTRALTVEKAIPELRIAFDAHRGEPRNADLALVGEAGGARVAVTIEAKADESFGGTVAETRKAAQARLAANPHSRGVTRLDDLLRSLLPASAQASADEDGLRYQLLTGVAGTLAFAVAERAASAVFVVHEFITAKTRDDLHDQNSADYVSFMRSLAPSLPATLESNVLYGPLQVGGAPLFTNPPPLFVGKVATNRR